MVGFVRLLVYVPTAPAPAPRHLHPLPWPLQAILGALLTQLAYPAATAELPGFI